MPDLNDERRASTGASSRESVGSNHTLSVNTTPIHAPSQSPAFPTREPVSAYVAALALFDWGARLVPLRRNRKELRAGFGPVAGGLKSYGDIYHYVCELDSNYAVCTGGERGLVVLDCDGGQVYEQLIDRYPILAETFTCTTANPNHYHVYLTVAGDVPSFTLGRLEIKARDRVVVGPACRVNDRRYTPLLWSAPILQVNPDSFSFFSKAPADTCGAALKKEKPHSGGGLIDRIKRGLSLVEVCEQHGIKLTGAGRFRKALCPFHSETTPSFTLDIARGLWLCYGCQARGDVVNLVARLDGLTLQDAIRKLAAAIPTG